MNKIIIGAPFGNYFSWPGTTSTLGTFTRDYRGNRLWRCLKTLRYNFKMRGWINSLGLPNPGINSLKIEHVNDNVIVSVYGFNQDDWIYLSKYSRDIGIRTIELNISCPNVKKNPELKFLPKLFCTHSVIVKLPPLRWIELAKPFYEEGIKTFHLCNTMPTPKGGLSGKTLKQYSLWAIEDFRQKWGKNVTLIGGGGITSMLDIHDYLLAGANHVSIASMLLNPLNWSKVSSWTLKL